MKKIEIHHEDMHFGLYLCTQGNCEMTINGKRCYISNGAAFVKSPLVQISHIVGSDDFEYVTIIEDEIVVLVSIASNNFGILNNLLYHNLFWLDLNKNEQEFLLRRKNLIDERKKELSALKIPSKQHQVISDIIIMLEQVTVLEYTRIILNRIDVGSIETEKGNDLMIHFIMLLFQNYIHHRDVGYYADALKLSRNHFTRIIKQISQRTPSEWIILVTINQAKKLLRQRDMNIKEVSQTLSFPEQFTFRKYFKQHTGMSPTEYKMKIYDKKTFTT